MTSPSNKPRPKLTHQTPTCLNPDCNDAADTNLMSGYCHSCQEWTDQTDPDFAYTDDA
jgi:hypothetical protein